jgi:hypothetical protein
MTALVGGEVQGKVSVVVGLLGLRAQAEKAGGEDLADLGKPLGGGHQVGIEGVGHVVVARREFLPLLITYRPGSANVGLHTLKMVNISLWLFA